MAASTLLLDLLLVAGTASWKSGPLLLGVDVVDDLCLGCLCEATSGCNMTVSCLEDRPLCGPFLVAPRYWQDADRPVILGDHPDRPGAYYRCVTDQFCAADTVRSYLGKYAQDCNGDGHVDCDDFGRIHYMGGYQCRQPVEHLRYYHVLSSCLSDVQQLNG